MKKYQQKQILIMLQTLDEARKEIDRLLSSGNKNEFIKLLQDVFDFIETIYKFINEIEGEGTETVRLLYDLKELITLVFRDASNNKPIESIFLFNLTRLLTSIENCVYEELKPKKIEFAFLPYNAGMADSLESVFLAAKDDPMCDAYWVPVPYYELNPDRSYGKMIYEGNGYPDNLPVTDWREYDLKTRKPDAVFIHNPYDNANDVTCVHPDFHAKNLMNHTNMLVYIPYFSMINMSGDKFCVLPGTIFADKVFVESELIRQVYIKAFIKWTNSIGIKKDHGILWEKVADPEKKFIAMGSPKYDKIINSKPEDFFLPDKWKQIIYKPDGSKKKVVLYNFRLTNIYTNMENHLKKLTGVLDFFKGKDDTAFWFRPHPLNIASLESMAPLYLHEYLNIINKYVDENWGVYDDTGDLHRALSICDIHYGDSSSIMYLFEFMGKPVVIQDADNFHTDMPLVLRLVDICTGADGRAWGFDMGGDGLYELNTIDHIARYAARSGFLPVYAGRKKLFNSRYANIFKYKNKIICFPQFLENILIYDCDKKISNTILINSKYLSPCESKGLTYGKIREYNKKLYFFSLYVKAIIVLDAVNHDIKYDTKLFDDIGFFTDSNETVKYPLYISECDDSGEVLLIMKDCDKLLRYNLETQGIVQSTAYGVPAKCCLADFDGSCFWFVSENNDKLINWEPETNKTVEYLFSKDGFNFQEMQYTFMGISDFGEYLLLFPGYGPMILNFNKTSGTFSEYKDLPMPDNRHSNVFKYYAPKETNSKIYAFASFNGTVYEMDKISGKIAPHKFYLNEESKNRYYNDFFNSIDDKNEHEAAYEIYEWYFGNIIDYFDRIKIDGKSYVVRQNNGHPTKTLNTDGSSGKKIYEYIRGVV